MKQACLFVFTMTIVLAITACSAVPKREPARFLQNTLAEPVTAEVETDSEPTCMGLLAALPSDWKQKAKCSVNSAKLSYAATIRTSAGIDLIGSARTQTSCLKFIEAFKSIAPGSRILSECAKRL
jgi:hypothetical protein